MFVIKSATAGKNWSLSGLDTTWFDVLSAEGYRQDDWQGKFVTFCLMDPQAPEYLWRRFSYYLTDRSVAGIQIVDALRMHKYPRTNYNNQTIPVRVRLFSLEEAEGIMAKLTRGIANPQKRFISCSDCILCGKQIRPPGTEASMGAPTDCCGPCSVSSECESIPSEFTHLALARMADAPPAKKRAIAPEDSP